MSSIDVSAETFLVDAILFVADRVFVPPSNVESSDVERSGL